MQSRLILAVSVSFNQHTMSLTTYSAAFPEALCVGPEGLQAKLPNLKNVRELKTNGAPSADEKCGFEEELESCYVRLSRSWCCPDVCRGTSTVRS